MIKVVIFDLDGTLVDSHTLMYEAYKNAFDCFDYDLSPEDWKLWRKEHMSPAIFCAQKQLSIDIARLRMLKQESYNELIFTSMKCKEGAFELIQKLSQNYILAIGSSSRKESIVNVVESLKIVEYFQILLSDLEVKARKPQPDVFLEIAKRLKCKSQECIVIGDSLSDVDSAHGAGMKCIVIPDNTQDEYFGEGADYVFDSLSKLKEIEGYIESII